MKLSTLISESTWCIAPHHPLADLLSMERPSATRAAIGPLVRDGVAVIDVAGVINKRIHLDGILSSSIAIGEQINWAVKSPSVQSIILNIDSPGGTSAGTYELAETVRQANKVKPLFAYASDLAASAAYWVGVEARLFYASPAARVGSIGTYLIIHDVSEMAAKEGVKVHVIRSSGAFLKGAGEPGTKITDEQLASFQKMVDGINAQFTSSVQKARRLSDGRMREITTGEVFMGSQAQALGLIDGLMRFDELKAMAVKAAAPPAPAPPKTISRVATPPVARPPQVSAAVRWNRAVDAHVANGMSRGDAIQRVNREHPGLREAMLKERNEAYQASR